MWHIFIAGRRRTRVSSRRRPDKDRHQDYALRALTHDRHMTEGRWEWSYVNCPVRPGFPGNRSDPRRLLDGDEKFHKDPDGFYRDLRRRYGALAPVELAPGVPATLVLNWDVAVKIMHDSGHFPSNPEKWQQSVPQDSPLLAMMAYHPSARDSDGAAHTRYREPSVAAIAGVNLFAMHDRVEQIGTRLVNEFLPKGRADLLSQYVYPLFFDVLNEVFGCPEDIGYRVGAAMHYRFNSRGEAPQAMISLNEALAELVEFKRSYPGDDITTRLMQHRVGLDDHEVIAQLLSFCGAGLEAAPNLVTNALLLMFTDSRFGGGLLYGSLSTRDALDEVLFNNPPMANFCFFYPRQPILIGDVWLPQHQPVVISIAACNNDPAITGADRFGNRSHLSFGAGPHACPASKLAYQVAMDAVDLLLDLVPDINLAVPADELEWRPGVIQRALVGLPTTFPRAEFSGPPPGTWPAPFAPIRSGQNAQRTTQRHRISDGPYQGAASGPAPAWG